MEQDRRYDIPADDVIPEGTLVDVAEGATWGWSRLSQCHHHGLGRVRGGPDYDGDYDVAMVGTGALLFVGHEHLDPVDDGGGRWHIGVTIGGPWDEPTPKDPTTEHVILRDKNQDLWAWTAVRRRWEHDVLHSSTDDLTTAYGPLTVVSTDEQREPEEVWWTGQVIPHSVPSAAHVTHDPKVPGVLVSDEGGGIWRWGLEDRVWRSTTAALRRSTRSLVTDYGPLTVVSHPHDTSQHNMPEPERSVDHPLIDDDDPAPATEPEPVTLPTRDTLDKTRRMVQVVSEEFPTFRSESILKVLDVVERIKDIEEEA